MRSAQSMPALLDPAVRSAQSMPALLDDGVEDRIVAGLADALASEAWDAEHRYLRALDAHEALAAARDLRA